MWSWRSLELRSLTMFYSLYKNKKCLTTRTIINSLLSKENVYIMNKIVDIYRKFKALKNIFPGKLLWLISCKSLEVFEIEKKSAPRGSLLPVGGQFNYSDQK